VQCTRRRWQLGSAVNWDPTRQPLESRGGADRRFSRRRRGLWPGQGPQMTTLTPRTRRCTRGGQWSSGDRSPPCMAEWSPAGHSRPRDGHGKGARAPGSQDEQDARKEKREGGAERRSPRSENLRRARPCSGKQCPLKGALSREAYASAGCARKRRSSKKDGGSGGELRRPEWATPASSRAGGVEESRSACSAAVVERRRKKWSEWGGAERLTALKAGVGSLGPRSATWSATPAHGGHGAAGACTRSGRARPHAGEGDAARAWAWAGESTLGQKEERGAREKGRAGYLMGRKGGDGPVSKENIFLFYFQIQIFLNSPKFEF
jgi:hypothetical protein